MEESNDHVIDIVHPYDAIVTSIAKKKESLCPLTSECCIYRVPPRFRRRGEAFYIPKVVSIGPLHHGDKGLEKMEEQKMIFLNDFLRRNNINFGQCFEIVEKCLERLRRCYAEGLGYKENEPELVKIIVVDAVFVVETLLKFSNGKVRDDNDRVFNQWILPDVQCEFLLLENQLPFFILEDLWQFETKGSVSPIECCYNFFTKRNFLNENKNWGEKIKKSPKHLLDLLRIFYEPASSTARGQDGQQRPSIATETIRCIPNATQLHEAGVELKVKKTNDLLDIDFTMGTLEIPQLEFNDTTELMIRNLIAFKQCYNCGNTYLSDYAALMDSIIDTPKDVDLLAQKAIVVNLLGRSDDVSAIINRLGDGVILDNTYTFHYADHCKKIDSYCKTPWHRWKAILKQNYFNTPWAIISFIAAVVLIVLTIIQTACSVISLL